MIFKNMQYNNKELLKADMRLLAFLIDERVSLEQNLNAYIFQRFDLKIRESKEEKEKLKAISDKEKYIKKNVDYRLQVDFIETRIYALCNALEKISNSDLDYIYDMLIFPIKIKDVVTKYNLLGESHCYRKLEKIVTRMIEKR